MEYEVRYYYPIKNIKMILDKIERIKGLKNGGRKYEKTIQYNHPSKEYDFYSKSIDGRFRLRITKSDNNSKCKLSWKRRLKDTFNSEVNKEEEVELTIIPEEYDNIVFIISNVLHMEKVESYERYRTTYVNSEVEIAIDEYPFGLAIEIEAQKMVENPTKVVNSYIEKLDLDENRRYRLSWDDKYEELCKEQGVEHFKYVEFEKPMPQVQ